MLEGQKKNNQLKFKKQRQDSMFDVVMNVCLDVRITFANDLELTAST